MLQMPRIKINDSKRPRRTRIILFFNRYYSRNSLGTISRITLVLIVDERKGRKCELINLHFAREIRESAKNGHNPTHEKPWLD
jgi:hypothetical protein